ncbi:hypothetical protein [uncultured Nonlabens sp.]|uniref:hypothetical protein n=1 Tax=uncultured Nonlabens sp. TaxID=859306 RepID=UPI002609E3AE|nr:hypothetical protein [uncultured Nonlabens sp.]
MKKILLFSSLCKPKSILEVTLPSWIAQENDDFVYDILLYNDNKDQSAIEFTNDFGQKHSKVTVISDWFKNTSSYSKHNWTQESVERIIYIKNRALEITQEKEYDAIFLVDSDLVLNPKTLQHLVGLQKDFVFEIFWTVFTDQTFAKPNCWDVHSWDYYNAQSILKLKEPGTYQVGAGGACTLLSTKALNKGVNFSKIKNIPYGGEDRHICTRAEVLGFPIYVDTHYPAFHIYNTGLLPKVEQWFLKKLSPSYFDTWLDKKWEQLVIESQKKQEIIVFKNSFQKIKMALYKARRSYINYIRYH